MIGFKGARIEIIEATITEIEYEVISNIPDQTRWLTTSTYENFLLCTHRLNIYRSRGFGFYQYVYVPAEIERAKQERIRLYQEQVRLKEEAKRLEREARAKVLNNAANACVELNNTMAGASGPSERIKILKSYGFEPVKAEIVNSTLEEINEMYNELKRWDEWGCSEYKDAKEVISCVHKKTPSCKEIYVKAYSGISIKDEMNRVFLDECKVRDTAKSCRALKEQLEEIERLQRQLRNL